MMRARAPRRWCPRLAYTIMLIVIASLARADQRGALVVHLGPSKTASSHTQAFLMANAEQLALNGWHWPRVNSSGRSQPIGVKAACCLAYALQGQRCEAAFAAQGIGCADADCVLRLWEASFRLMSASHERRNMVISSECLVALNASHVQRLLSWAAPWFAQVSAVLVYRRPRSTHLVSHYSQVRREAHAPTGSFSDWVVSAALNGSAGYHGSVGELWHAASAWSRAGVRLVIVDQAGATRRGRDITDVVACSVLNASASCDSLGKWVVQQHLNSKAARATQALFDRRSAGLGEHSRIQLELFEATQPVARAVCLDRGGLDPTRLHRLAGSLSHRAPRRCIDLSILDEALVGLDEHRRAQLAPSVELVYFDEGTPELASRTVCELDREALLQDEAVLRQVAGACHHRTAEK